MSEPTPEALAAAAEAIAGYCAADWPSQAYEGEAEAALSAAAPYLIREAQAKALEDAANSWWDRGPEDWLRARAAAIRDGAE